VATKQSLAAGRSVKGEIPQKTQGWLYNCFAQHARNDCVEFSIKYELKDY